MQLIDLQQRFVASLVLETTDPTLFANLATKNNSALTVHQRFALYRNNRRESLVKTLKNIYPVCFCLLGDKCFSGLSRQFIGQTVSTHFSLNDFGNHFSEFIKAYSVLWSLPYLPEVAALEWIIYLTLLGPDNSQLSLNALQNIPEDKQGEVIFGLAENGSLFTSDFSVDSIWSAHQNLTKGVMINAESVVCVVPELNCVEGSVNLFIYREVASEALCLASLNSLEWRLLQGIALGQPLHRLYENFTQEETAAAVTTLASCLRKGYITRCYVPSLEIAFL